ncbi:multidrug transporter [Klebsiella pneumoniae]|nr:multidrug transporter [Klebsiella pneumoniae]
MPHFFIERPIFAWVIALFIVLTGLLSIPRLPVAQYLKLRHPVLSFQ